MLSVDERAVAALRAHLRGQLLTCRDPGDGDTRRLWNGRIDRYPAIIARCRDIADIVACVRFARECQLDLAVRGGGYAVAGTAMCNGGIVVDLSGMKGMRVDPAARRVSVQAGEN